MISSFKRVVGYFFRSLGYQIKPLPKGKPSPIHLWEDDEVFQSTFREMHSYTLVSVQRCYIIYQLIQQILSLPGEIAEVGVYKGGTAYLIADGIATSNKHLHLFDTFLGMPATDPTKDTHVEGNFGDTSLQAVSTYLRDFKNVSLYEGLFPLTARPIENKTFSLVHIDVDIYQSVIDCCQFFYNRMNPRGTLIFDDYGDISCPGAKEAVDEFFADKPEYPCYLSTGQCLVIKL